MEWIYFVIIFFYILSALSKAAKKKQAEAQKAVAAKQVNRRVEAHSAQPETTRSTFETAAEALTDLPLRDVMRFVDEKMNARKTAQETIETIDYDLTSRFEPSVSKEDVVIDREHSTASHFHTAEGIRSSVHDMSKLATAPQFASATFTFGTKRKERHVLNLRGADLQKYIIVSEILAKPKALRK
jgi:hypothetical protein